MLWHSLLCFKDLTNIRLMPKQNQQRYIFFSFFPSPSDDLNQVDLSQGF